MDDDDDDDEKSDENVEQEIDMESNAQATSDDDDASSDTSSEWSASSDTPSEWSASSDASSDESDDDDLGVGQYGKVKNVNFWEMVRESADEDFDGNALDAYVALIGTWRLYMKDKYHQKVMDTLQSYREGAHNMDFREALIKAAKKRKHLIRRKVEEAGESEEYSWLEIDHCIECN